jgi:nucleoside-diphosphate-sugar epimerase
MSHSYKTRNIVVDGLAMDRIIVSGATGIIGFELVKKLMRHSSAEIVCLFLNYDTGAKTLIELAEKCGAHLTVLRCDLAREEDIIRTINSIAGRKKTLGVHLAADVSWSKELEEISALNIEGSVNFCRIVKSTSAQASIIYVSSAYTAMENWEYRNSYEESKAIAERRIRESFRDLPISTFSCSLVLGDSTTGKINRFHGLYPLIKYMTLFDVPFLVARPDCLVDLIPVDWTVNELFELVNRIICNGVTSNVVASAGNSRIKAKDLVQIIYDRINAFRTIRGLDPKPIPAMIPFRRWLFLQRSIKAWNIRNICPKVLQYYEALMKSYKHYIESDMVLPPRNITQAAPNPRNYLSTVIDYWLDKNKKMIERKLCRDDGVKSNVI